jgi:hypothetical protein
LPARISKEEAGLWGANENGDYLGKSQKNHPVGIQNASEVKARILKNATEDRIVKVQVYKSPIPLDEHPLEPCIVLDPFGGSGTTAQVAMEHGRTAIMVELNRESLPLINERISKTEPTLNLPV